MSQRAYIGVDLGGTNIKYGLVSARGDVFLERIRPTGVSKGRSAILRNVRESIEELITFGQHVGHAAQAIGIGSPGTINIITGEVMDNCPNIPDWVGVNLKIEMESQIDLPVAVDNDTNLMALAELHLGAGRGFRNLICITIGTGIGGGIVIDRQIYRGSWYAGAELGHMTIAWNGPACACGNLGCLEVFASAPALIRRYLEQNKSQKVSKRITIEQIFAFARNGDLVAGGVIKDTARLLGAGLASLVNAFNPEALVIGGGMAEADDHFIQTTEEEVRRRAFTSATAQLKVTRAHLGNKAGFIGAALWAHEFVSH